MNSFISWVGGKKALREEIYKRMPIKYERYIEVFGGGGWVLFGKKEDKFEVYNDMNSYLVNLFRCVKNRPIEFIKELNFLPLNSREEFNEIKKFLKKEEIKYEYMEEQLKIAKESLNEEDFEEILQLFNEEILLDDVKKAVGFYKLIRYSYGSSVKSYGSNVVDIRKTFGTIWEANRRLKNTIIENKDFEALIRHYDNESAFFYCDPPYYETENYYQNIEFKEADHIRLKETLAEIKGKFLLSYNDCEYIKNLYKDFYIEEISRVNSMGLRYDNGIYKEVLISNYNTKEKEIYKPEQIKLF